MVARQPIYGANLGVRGYELLFRGPGARTTDGISMTADVLVRAGLDVGVADLVGDKRVFVKAPRPFLVGDLEFPLPPRQTVIEVVQDVARTPEVVTGCRHLVQNGYTLALDHYVWDDDDDPLLDMVSIIKLDVLTLTPAQLSSAVSHNSKFGVELLAEKIETREQLEVCRKLGFNLFEGYLLGRPDVIEGDALCPDRVVCLRILEELGRPGTSGREVQDLVQADPALSYRFLRAAAAGSGRGLFPRLHSVREAVISLGARRLHTWVTLMVLASCCQTTDEHLEMVMARARACELTALAQGLEPRQVDAAFTVGLLSALEHLFTTPLPAIIEGLSLTGEVEDALLGHEGVLGRALTEVRQREAFVGEHDGPYLLVTPDDEAGTLNGHNWPAGGPRP